MMKMADALNYKSKNSITVLVNRLAKRNELKKKLKAIGET
jgi:hypothetical protein